MTHAAERATSKNLVSRAIFDSVCIKALRLAQDKLRGVDGESALWHEAMQAISAALMLAPLDGPAQASAPAQAMIPGPKNAPLWRVPLTVDASLSAVIFARGESADEAKRYAQEFAAEDGQELFELDDGNYRGPSDYYGTGDIERAEYIIEAEAPVVEGGADDSGVRKSTFLVTVLHLEGETDDVAASDRHTIDLEIDQGDWIGRHAYLTTEVVPKRELQAVQESVGNDGSFFGYLAEEA